MTKPATSTGMDFFAELRAIDPSVRAAVAATLKLAADRIGARDPMKTHALYEVASIVMHGECRLPEGASVDW